MSLGIRFSQNANKQIKTNSLQFIRFKFMQASLQVTCCLISCQRLFLYFLICRSSLKCLQNYSASQILSFGNAYPVHKIACIINFQQLSEISTTLISSNHTNSLRWFSMLWRSEAFMSVYLPFFDLNIVTLNVLIFDKLTTGVFVHRAIYAFITDTCIQHMVT